MICSPLERLVVGTLLIAALISPVVGAGNPTVTTVYVFQGGSDGGPAVGDIVVGPDGAIYGKTIKNSDAITVFRLDPAAGVNKSLFVGYPGATDDANSGVVFGANGGLYGASYFNGGSGLCAVGCGLIFQVDGVTGALSTIYQFLNNGDGRGTHAVVIGSGGAIYGLSDEGGTANQGSIFRVNPATGRRATLYSFTGGIDGNGGDAGVRFGPDEALYGETTGGGQFGSGTLFRLDTLTHGFRILYQFTAADGNTHIFNSPPTLVVEQNGSIFGTTVTGGAYGKGMIFCLVPATGTLTVLHSFSGSDGRNPTRLVIGTDGKLYGLTVYGGTADFGTVFQFDLHSGTFTSIYSFTNTTDGAHPGQGGLTVSVDGTIYGTTLSGGGPNGTGHGTVFKIAL
jgi:uncharacterized repeat protein (TIGR03803 family)